MNLSECIDCFVPLLLDAYSAQLSAVIRAGALPSDMSALERRLRQLDVLLVHMESLTRRDVATQQHVQGDLLEKMVPIGPSSTPEALMLRVRIKLQPQEPELVEQHTDKACNIEAYHRSITDMIERLEIRGRIHS